MKTALALLVLAALCSLGVIIYQRTPRETHMREEAPSSRPVASTAIRPPEAISPKAPAVSAPSPATLPATPPTQSNAAPPTKVAPQIVFESVFGPDSLYHDDLLGVSATLPDGWAIRQAVRWGENNLQNTVVMVTGTTTTARPSMYYQMYSEGVPDLGAAEAYLRDLAQKKQDARVAAGLSDYQNVPGSFAYTDTAGRPSLSYFATFSVGNEVMTEYFIRILGQKGYVMFFTTGKFEDVQAIMPQLKQMAGTVKVP
jgi:hypothetical protein